MATFMVQMVARLARQSGHIHISLTDKNGDAVFYDPATEDHMSTQMRHFIGGQQALMPELLSMISPTVNSFTRLIPGFWAPTSASWGVENRTCALRAIPGKSSSQRVEYRIAAADINPYVAIAAAIGSGLWGIENEIEPGKPVVGSAYEGDFPKEISVTQNVIGGGRTTARFKSRACAIRRGLCGSLCSHAGMGRARVSKAHYGLGDESVLRDYLIRQRFVRG